MKHHRIAIIGLGYVGLPLALALARHHRVVGYDSDADRIAELRAGRDRSGNLGAAELAGAGLAFSDDPESLRDAEVHIIAVPTPLNHARQPDLGPLLAASELLGSRLRPGATVIYESTVYPGATEEECIPVLERASGLVCGRDFHVGYSPERINPGDVEHSLQNTVKVIAAADEATLALMQALYGQVVQAGLHRAGSIRVAEAAKVIENTQRDINIALMNEFALVFETMGLDTMDVLEAAGSKWNFLPFTPGLVGGHCIGVDPYYLTYKALLEGYAPRLILAGRSINDSMGRHVARAVVHGLILRGERVQGGRVSVLGLSFKPDVGDVRNSRVVELVAELRAFGMQVQVHDPVADAEAAREEHGLQLLAYEELQAAMAVVLAVPHRCFLDGGWPRVSGLLHEGRGLVFDVKAVLPRAQIPAGITLRRL